MFMADREGESSNPDVFETLEHWGKTGEKTYSCEVLAEVNGQELSDTVPMTKLGGKWRIKQ